MRNFKLNLGSLDPELKGDLQKFRIAVYYGKQKEVEELHRPKRKMRQNAVMIYIFYNYVSSNLLNVPLLFLLL
jgi:hypothetical protein